MLLIKINYSRDDIKEAIALFKASWKLTTKYDSFRKIPGKNQYLITFEEIKNDITLTVELKSKEVQVGVVEYSNMEEYKEILYSMLKAFEVVIGEEVQLTIRNDSGAKYILDNNLSAGYKYSFTSDRVSYFTNNSEEGKKVKLNIDFENQFRTITDTDISKAANAEDEFMIIKSKVKDASMYSVEKVYELEVCKNATDIVSIYILGTEIIINSEVLKIANPDSVEVLEESTCLVDVIVNAFKEFELDFLLAERKINLKDKFGFGEISNEYDSVHLIEEIKDGVRELLPIPPERTALGMMKYVAGYSSDYEKWKDATFRLDFKSDGLDGDGHTDFRVYKYKYKIEVDAITTETLHLYLIKSSRGFSNERWEILSIKKANSYKPREIAILANNKVTSYYLVDLENE